MKHIWITCIYEGDSYYFTSKNKAVKWAERLEGIDIDYAGVRLFEDGSEVGNIYKAKVK